MTRNTQAVYRNSDGVLFYGRKPGDGYPDISSLTAWDPLGHEDFSAYSLPDEIRILSRSKKGVDRNSSLYMGSPSLFKPFMPRSGVDPDTNLVEKIDDGDREAIFSAEIIRPSEARPVARIKDLKSMGLAAGGKLSMFSGLLYGPTLCLCLLNLENVDRSGVTCFSFLTWSVQR